jgi:uncharacterized paraquat-inducible protein A
MKQGFTQCTDCNVWSNIPSGFKENKHFARCPKCNKPMYLALNVQPSEIGLTDRTKVDATLMSQAGY